MRWIYEFVLRRLHNFLFKYSANPLDDQFAANLKRLSWVSPAQFAVPHAEQVFRPHIWQTVTSTLQTMTKLKSPLEKVDIIQRAITMI